MASTFKKHLPNIAITRADGAEGGEAETPTECTYQYLLRSSCLDSVQPEVVEDMLRDANQLVGIAEATEGVVRDRLKLRRSTLLPLTGPAEEAEEQRHPPIEDNSLQINLSEDESKFILLTFSSHYTVWTWSKYLQAAHAHWADGNTDGNDDSGNPAPLTTHAELRTPQHSYQGNVTVSYEWPFELLVSGEIMSLQGMLSLVLAVDSIPASRICGKLRVKNIVETEGAKRRKSFTGSLQTAANAAKGLVKGMLHRKRIEDEIQRMPDKLFVVANSSGSKSILDGEVLVDNAGSAPVLLSLHHGKHFIGNAICDLQEDGMKRSVNFYGNTGLKLSLISCQGLASPKSSFSHLYPKCTILGGSGHRNNKDTIILSGPTIPFSADPFWPTGELVFNIHSEYTSMAYIRLELIAFNTLKSTGCSLGAIFIPFAAIAESSEQQYTVHNFRRSELQGSFGTVTVMLERVFAEQCATAEVSLETCTPPLSATGWFGEVVLGSTVENCQVHVDQQALLLQLPAKGSAVLNACKEAAGHVVRVLYDRVVSVDAITASVVCVSMTIAKHTNKGFEDAQVELFITNCSDALAAVLTDRMTMADIRLEVQDCLQTTGKRKVLSLYTDIDYHTYGLEQATDLDAPTCRAIARFRLYLASLLTMHFATEHKYQASNLQALLVGDFQSAQEISMDSEVTTASNRIEFLLDIAEKRIREAALCGWQYRGKGLEDALSTLANGYFMEIIGVLGVFFEDIGQNAAKGLSSKIELINTFMNHNDRLDVILSSALRPYGLIAQPAPKLTLFLDFSILVSWYTSVLTMEMRSRVEGVLAVWKDKEQDVTGRAAHYRYPLAWLPQRLGDDGIFFSSIPEDLVEVLVTYLSLARIYEDSIAPSFRSELGNLDTKVCLAYTNSFLYLSEEYQKALDEKNWLAMTDEEELAEYITFLCGVANDASRVLATNLHHAPNPPAVQDSLLTDMQSQVSTAFDDVRYRSLDQLSCLVFQSLFHEREVFLTADAHSFWFTHQEDEEDLRLFTTIVEELVTSLEDLVSFLEPLAFAVLLEICCKKMTILFLTLLVALPAGEQESMRHQLCDDMTSIETGFSKLLQHLSASSVSLQILQPLFHILDSVGVFVYEEILTPPFILQLKGLLKDMREHKKRTYGLCKLLEMCLRLRGFPAPCQLPGNLDPFMREVLCLRQEYANEWVAEMAARATACVEAHSFIQPQITTKSNPLCQVFVKDKDDQKSLVVLLIHSAQTVQPEHEKDSKFFSIKLPHGPALKMLIASRNRLHRLMISPAFHQFSDAGKVLTKTTLQFSDINISGSIPFATHSSCVVFLRFQLDDARVRTKALSLRPKSLCHFDPVVLPFHSSSELIKIHISLWEEVMFVAEKLASYTLEFMAFSPPTLRNKEVQFSEWSTSLRVVYALKRAQRRNEELPQLSFSLTPSA